MRSSIYNDYADWFHLLTAPADYADEAVWVHEAITARAGGATLLELGSGGGNMASYLRAWYEMTLTDLSPAMLALSQTINPDVPHIAGDMKTLRLGGQLFDAVLIHDAIDYMMTPAELGEALVTAFVHLNAGGVIVVMPDHVAETFSPSLNSGGHDGPDGRGLRYLEWTHPANPDATVDVDFVCLLREAGGSVHTVHDRHSFGLFERAVWLRQFESAGFVDIEVVVDPWAREVFIASKPD